LETVIKITETADRRIRERESIQEKGVTGLSPGKKEIRKLEEKTRTGGKKVCSELDKELRKKKCEVLSRERGTLLSLRRKR